MADSAEIGAGSVIGGFKLERELGRGGMGVVYKAHELSLNRKVALKILSERLSSDEDFVRRFKREARVVAALNHPNIVQILSYGEEKGLYYFAMEYVSGTDLGQILEEKGKIPLDGALSITAQVADALGEAAARGVVHRDLKPSNIMIDSMGRTKVTDFGIASFKDADARLTRTGMFLGTPEFSSPEQVAGEPLDVRSDIYSLGAVLYKMLSGELPVTGKSPVAVVARVMTEPVRPIRQVNPSVPDPVCDLIEKMMARDINERFQSPGEVLTAIHGCVDQLKSETPLTRSNLKEALAVTAPESRFRDRARAVGAAAGIAAAVLFAVWAVDAFFNRGEVPVEPEKIKSEKSVAEPPSSTVTDAGHTEKTVETAEAPKTTVSQETRAEEIAAGYAEEDAVQERVGPDTVAPKAAVGQETHEDRTGSEKNETVTAEPPVMLAKVRQEAPLPEVPLVLTIVSGDANLVPFVRNYIESAVMGSGLKVTSITDIPVLVEKMQMGNMPITWHDIEHYVPTDKANILLLAEIQKTGSTELYYYGRYQELITTSFSIRAVDTSTGTAAGNPVTGTARFTGLNMDEELSSAVKSSAGKMGIRIREYWKGKIRE
ncbi:MAG TPA: serine/threonine protein kinase [Thermodesulfobacteriaceae bacterium]|nr:serine/threonine protein kinase [Thermodesulfobacteriaceae bacterium]